MLFGLVLLLVLKLIGGCEVLGLVEPNSAADTPRGAIEGSTNGQESDGLIDEVLGKSVAPNTLEDKQFFSDNSAVECLTYLISQ